MNDRDKEFSKKAKAAFDSSVDELDAATLSRLNRSRHEALAELHKPTRHVSNWMPATGVAAAVVVAVVVLQIPGVDNDELPAAVSDMEILLGEDSIEMLEELEFYSWLDAADLDNDVG